MTSLSPQVRNRAVRAFQDYERVVVVRLLRKPEGKLDRSPLREALSTKDDQVVGVFAAKFERACYEILHSVIV